MSVYLDHNATTPLDSRVLEAMLPWLQGQFGNPSSQHQLGRESQRAIEVAREQVAALVNVQPSQLFFTSGGTEANNLVIKGVLAAAGAGSALAISAVEHSSVLQSAQAVMLSGHPLTVIDVDGSGVLQFDQFAQALMQEGSSLVSVMLANNESGVVQDVARLAEKARSHGVIMHTDAVQALGKMVVDFEALGVAGMSLSAHKIYGPKGCGALVVEKGLGLQPILHGGGHEMGMRAGTENLAGIVGFGRAAELLQAELNQRIDHAEQLRGYAEQELQKIPEIVIFGQQAACLPNTIFFAVRGIEGATLLMALDRDGIAVSSGSACASGRGEPSHVLRAMGVGTELAHGAVRVSFGKENTIEEVDRLLTSLKHQINSLIQLNSAWA